jgi:hypothetical protein
MATYNIYKLIRYVSNPTIMSLLHRYKLHMVHIELGTPNFSLVNKKIIYVSIYIVCLLKRDRKNVTISVIIQ